jgi:hypothetical protein
MDRYLFCGWLLLKLVVTLSTSTWVVTDAFETRQQCVQYLGEIGRVKTMCVPSGTDIGRIEK